jgi:hypothetical protein
MRWEGDNFVAVMNLLSQQAGEIKEMKSESRPDIWSKYEPTTSQESHCSTIQLSLILENTEFLHELFAILHSPFVSMFLYYRNESVSDSRATTACVINTSE